ncbi:L-idonate 5-dehydrogenase [Lonepinella koalarum]|uniref:L-idonate 5-dehydrogenase n=1 Tax=Lonepinella koalarum TaxID=53417 RepID=UPI003F6DE10F
MKTYYLETKSCVMHEAKKVKVELKQVQYTDDDIVVQVSHGGICGSDIHYYHEGRVGLSIIKHPFTIGHEFTGVIYHAPQNSHLKVGQKVAINPSQPCLHCQFCREGKQHACLSMRFMGTAQRVPHTEGGFSQYVKVTEEQCFPYKNCKPEIMVFAEPLAVVIHAINQAGSLLGKKVLITGAGPIGCLLTAAVKAAGATEIVVSDITENSRQLALKMGASKVIDALDETIFEHYAENKGYFDVAFEASASVAAINSTVQATRQNGVIVQVGMGINLNRYPVDLMIVKELSWKGTFRFLHEFSTAVIWLENQVIDPSPLITSSYKLENIEDALITAANKKISSKVQITFD